MAPQHVEVLETLINLKRKIRRDKEGENKSRSLWYDLRLY